MYWHKNIIQIKRLGTRPNSRKRAKPTQCLEIKRSALNTTRMDEHSPEADSTVVVVLRDLISHNSNKVSVVVLMVLNLILVIYLVKYLEVMEDRKHVVGATFQWMSNLTLKMLPSVQKERYS